MNVILTHLALVADFDNPNVPRCDMHEYFALGMTPDSDLQFRTLWGGSYSNPVVFYNLVQ